jgi:hypothetical protein
MRQQQLPADQLAAATTLPALNAAAQISSCFENEKVIPAVSPLLL